MNMNVWSELAVQGTGGFEFKKSNAGKSECPGGLNEARKGHGEPWQAAKRYSYRAVKLINVF